MMSFFQQMLASFPDTVTVPEPLIAYFKWIEEHGLDRNFDNDDYSYAYIDPSQEQSCIGIELVDLDYAKSWTKSNDPVIYNRLAAFCKAGGDGTYIALWVDDEGQTKIVILGSGSGSTLLGVFVNDAIDFLRLLAIGYDELCWPENYDKSPLEVWEEEFGDEEDEEYSNPKPIAPFALQNWVKETFNTSIPNKASDILTEICEMDDDEGNDPFWNWIRSLEPKE